jgi:hypothetical protein
MAIFNVDVAISFVQKILLAWNNITICIGDRFSFSVREKLISSFFR